MGNLCQGAKKETKVEQPQGAKKDVKVEPPVQPIKSVKQEEKKEEAKIEGAQKGGVFEIS